MCIRDSFRFLAFLSSFIQDYDTVGGGAAQGEPLRVWASTNDLISSGYATGRDQAQILSRLITDSFTPSPGIPVTVSLSLIHIFCFRRATAFSGLGTS